MNNRHAIFDRAIVSIGFGVSAARREMVKHLSVTPESPEFNSRIALVDLLWDYS